MTRDELIAAITPEVEKILEILAKEDPDKAVQITREGAQVIDGIRMPHIYSGIRAQ